MLWNMQTRQNLLEKIVLYNQYEGQKHRVLCVKTFSLTRVPETERAASALQGSYKSHLQTDKIIFSGA